MQTSLELKEKRIQDIQTAAEQEKAHAHEKVEGYKEALRTILKTQVAAEQKNARSKHLENIQRLGWVQAVRYGPNSFGEQWNEGSVSLSLLPSTTCTHLAWLT